MATVLVERGSNMANHPEPNSGNVWSPSTADREQLGSLAQPDKNDDYLDIAPHLREPVEDEEECYGPVPPGDETVYVGQDPFVRDAGVLPTPGIHR